MGEGANPSRWERARTDTPGITARREIVAAFLGGALAVIGLVVFGSPSDPVTGEIIVASAAVLGALLLHPLELGWNYLWTPWRQLKGDVLALRREVETEDAASSAPSTATQLFRPAVSLIADDLEHLTTLVRERDHRTFFDWYSIYTRNWNQHGAVLANLEYPELHRVVRAAYQALERAFNDCKTLQTGHDSYAYQLTDERSEAALKACDEALAALHEVESE